MGNSTGRVTQGGEQIHDLPDQYYGVSVSGNNLENSLQKAYNQGRDEEKAKLETALNALAAQVYDNVHEQLQDVQKRQLEESVRLTDELKLKLRQPVALQTLCDNERASVISCIKANKNATLACADILDNYNTCASMAVVGSPSKAK